MYDSFFNDYAFVFYGNINEFNNDDCLHSLSEKEVFRSKQILLDIDKQRFIITRSLLKRLISIFLKVDTKEIEIRNNKNGKPFLANYQDLQFNVSHTNNIFVIAFVNGKNIGVDIEDQNRILNISLLKDILFTPAELNIFNTIENNLKNDFIIHYWTTKESILKATGEGLSKPMNELEIANLDKNWFIESKNILDNYRVAIAIDRNVKGIKYIPLNESGLYNNLTNDFSN